MIEKFKKRIKHFIKGEISGLQAAQNTQVEQTIIANQYRLMKKMLTPGEMPAFNGVGFRVYSQFEEDGILLYIYSIIGYYK